jgi:hypothetical protein
MRKSAAIFPIALAAIILAPEAAAQAQDARGEPTEIEKCQTINQPGSYKLVNNLTFKPTNGTCLPITANFVTIDLAGFSISGPRGFPNNTTAIAAGVDTNGIAVRNGSISGFGNGVGLGGDGSVVEGLRVFGGPSSVGIAARGIVKGNTVEGFAGPSFARGGPGIDATGIVTGNYVSFNETGIDVGQGSTVIGNTVTNNIVRGILVSCPSNVTDNTAVNNFGSNNVNLVLEGEGCNNTNNVAP